jgi:hypothetical protein
MKTPRVLLAVLLLSLVIGSQAVAGDVKSADEVQDIDLSEIIKSVAADAKDSGDEQLAQVLEMVRSIRVKGFTLGKDGADDVAKAVDRITKDLKKNDWKRLIYLKDGDEIMSVSTKYKGEDLVGLMVLAYEPGHEALFVNVVGDLDLPTLMKLVGGMDGDGLEDLLENLDGVGEIEIETN